jgi:hypothetical protein
MYSHKRTRLYSIIVGVVFLMVLVVEPRPILLSAYMQSSQEAEGSSSRNSEELNADLKDPQYLDQDSVEADPFAPDDRETPSTTAATAAYPIPVPLPGGLDHVANGVGTRNAGFGTIRLRGVPPGSVAVRAFLYWGTIQAAAALNQVVCFNGQRVVGQLIGTAVPSCWGPGVFCAYRASVIALLTPGINADYRVSCMPSSIVDGRDPWDRCVGPVPAPLPLSEGASLVVVYANRCIPRTAQLFINDGAAFFAVGGININNPFPPGILLKPYAVLKHTRLGGDGQVGSSTFSNLAITDERSFLGPPFFTQIKGHFSNFNWDSDWNGADGVPLNQLWDTHTDSFGQILTPGIANYVVRYVSNGDCVFAVAHVLSTR